MDDMVNEKVGIALFYCLRRAICFKIKNSSSKTSFKDKNSISKFFLGKMHFNDELFLINELKIRRF